MQQQKKKDFLINTVYYLVIFVALFVFLKLLFGALLPFFVAIVITVAIQSISRKISKKFGFDISKVSAFSVLAVYFLIALFLFLLFYMLYIELWSVVKNLPQYADLLFTYFSKAVSFFEKGLQLFPPELSEKISEIVSSATEKMVSDISVLLTNFTASVVTKIPSILITTIVTVVASHYIARDYEVMRQFLLGCMSKKLSSKIAFVKNLCFGYIFKIIKGYSILLLLTFIELLIGLLLLGKKYAVLLALIISLIDILPVLGTGAVLIPWGAIELFSGRILDGVLLILLYVVIMVVRNIAEPKIIGKQIGIHPVLMLIAIYSGYKIAGLWGVLLFPIAIVVIKSWLEMKNSAEENK